VIGTFATPTAEEWPFIFDSWARSFRNSRVVVLVNATESGERRVIGYSVSDPKRRIIHYVYVKRDWRGLGAGRELRRDIVSDAELAGWSYTYRTSACGKFYRSAKHRPELARIKV
jgi:GNAT superfamily N-acetyltransferase